jgi:hypothetical protein
VRELLGKVQASRGDTAGLVRACLGAGEIHLLPYKASRDDLQAINSEPGVLKKVQSLTTVRDKVPDLTARVHTVNWYTYMGGFIIQTQPAGDRKGGIHDKFPPSMVNL